MNVSSSISKVAANKPQRRSGKGKMSSYGRRGGGRGKRGNNGAGGNNNAGTKGGRNLSEEEGKIAGFAEDAVHKQGLCVEILAGGFVQSYVDFFYLMHRPDPNPDPNRPEMADAEIQVSPEDMTFIKEKLITAESARRQGDTNIVFESYSALARYFQDAQDSKTGIYFYEICLEIARLTSDLLGEIRANNNLGLAHARLNDIDTALGFHEKQYELTKGGDDNLRSALDEEAKTAGFELVKMYQKKAEAVENVSSNNGDKDIDEAIKYHEKCLNAAKVTGHAQTIGAASYRLGRAHVINGNATGAIGFLEAYLQSCMKAKDLEGQGEACSALAAAHQALDDTDEAVKNLQKHLEIAKQTDKLAAQAEACCNLGVIYNRRGEFDKAVHFFERNFETTRSIVASGKSSRKIVDKARVNLGMARGNAQQNSYMNVINYDLSALLLWKNRRLNFGSGNKK